MAKNKRRLPWPAAAVAQVLFVASLLSSALYLSWVSLSAVDFLYPLWYEVLNIGENIDRYGPENRFKRGFEDTDKAERLRLFGAIAEAVNQGGQGLATIAYADARGREIALLREPERIHLESVARLIDRLRVGAYLGLLLLVGTVAVLKLSGVALPSGRRVLVGVAVGAGLGTAVVLALGAERVFYALHDWVFPAGEQWFFYYQDSLMTTLMKAPDLFGAIAVALLLVALAWVVVLLTGVRWLLRE